MRKMLAKAAAGLLALTLAVGAVPGNVFTKGSIDTAVVASAETVAVGDVYKIGDTIDFGDGANINRYGYYGNSEFVSGSATLSYDFFDGDDNTYCFTLGGISFGSSLFVNYSGFNGKPLGIRVTSGNGTYEDPFQFEVVFGDVSSVAGNISVGDIYRKGDSIEFGSGTFIILDSGESAPKAFSDTKTIESGGSYLSGWGQYSFGPSGTEYVIFITSKDLGDADGIKITGGEGTKDAPFTLGLAFDLADGQYKQTAEKDGEYYTRFVFVTPKSQLEGHGEGRFHRRLQRHPLHL